MWKYILAWLPMIIVAIANGLLREKFLARRLNDLQAHQMSTASMIVLLGIYIWILFKIWPPISANQTIIVGLTWLLLTIIFELLFGHYIAGHTWEKLLHDYNLFQGRVWIFVLVWISIAPYIMYQIQK